MAERVHNAESRRLDARGIAALYGLTLAQFARATGLDYEATRKTPDSTALQDLLAQLYRIWDAASEGLQDDEEATRRWFHRPNRALDRERPIDLLRRDRLDELEEFVKRMRVAEYY